MSTPGTDEHSSSSNTPLVVVGDTDGLIAILHEADLHHRQAVETVSKLLAHDAQTVFPLTTITETITTLIRKLNQPQLAESVVRRITNRGLTIENTDTDMLNVALKVFDPKGSKKKTIFDAMVVATAKKLNTNIILSFDDWYSKLGFTLAVKLF